ncbi:hypothetical protein O6H91_03G070400 [Diphasiastrum complanatum]|uniref:Uncharacterized protein n=1 Tax=Diphasiastrum complanatum TaxID=34168 RepID=A0ACC2E7P9_DIPCM|nr:hypothetical protein O6H91_03G070400 [Diphasiastrum complanatum]
MDPTLAPVLASAEDEEWDAEGFEIPSLNKAKGLTGRNERTLADNSSKSSLHKVKGISENIYLGPHGAKPIQSKQQEVNSSAKKLWLKQKLKDAEKKVALPGHGHEK